MGLENLALVNTHDFSIRHDGDVHSGKVRSVYWLTPKDSRRIIEEEAYDKISEDAQLGIMIISDRISAFDCPWRSEDGLGGVPKKGASLNVDSAHWFRKFDEAGGLAGNHILDMPHPLVWIVQKAQPIMIEAIARAYITGSMWRDYSGGQREFGGVILSDGLTKNQRLDRLLITPSTKGVMKGIPGIPEKDDTNITRQQIVDNYKAFGFRSVDDVDVYETLLRRGFDLISTELERVGQIFVDTKFEFGYVSDGKGGWDMIYIDEVGTPDSSRFWSAEQYERDPLNVTEESKEGFRQFLILVHGKDVMTDKSRMDERVRIARDYRVPVEQFMEVSRTYTDIAKRITGRTVSKVENPREGIMDVVSGYGLAA